MITLGRTFKEDFSAFLKDYALYICIGIAVIILATIIIIYVIKNKKKKTPQINYDSNFNLWIEYLGGKDNIKEVSGIGSRLTVSLQDNTLIREEIKDLGVTNMMKMSDKTILVIENSATEIAENIKKSLQNSND